MELGLPRSVMLKLERIKRRMKNYVLILSSMYDFSTDLVVQRLENNGDNFIRLNKEQLSDYEIF